MTAIVCFDFTDEYGTEDEGESHYYQADDEAGGGEKIGAVVGGEFFGMFVQHL